MTSFQELWSAYGRARRPANIGEEIDGVLIGELDETVQDVASAFAGMGSAIGARRVAELGLALTDLTRVLPRLEPQATRDYFDLVTQVARATLTAIARAGE